MDATQGLRLAVPPIFQEVVASFDRETTQAARVQSGVVNSVLRVLDTYFLLDTERCRTWVSYFQARKDGVNAHGSNGKLSLRVLNDARFSCRACGDCCRGFAVGPLRDDDVERIRRHDWTSEPPHATHEEILSEPEPGQVYLTLRDGHCIFLADDDKCIIHTRHGALEKPQMCRDFPYRHTRAADGRVDVTLRFECSNIHRARIDGEALRDQQERLHALFEQKRETTPSPMPLLFLETGIAVPAMTASAFDALILRIFETEQPVEEQVLAYRAALVEWVQRLRPTATAANVEACERWLAQTRPERFSNRPHELDRAACLSAFARIVGTFADAAMRRFFHLRARGEQLPGGEAPQHTVITSLLTLQRRMADLRAHSPVLLSRFDHAAVSAVHDAGEDPLVRGLTRDFFKNQIRCRFAAASSSLIVGHASNLVLFLLAKWHAKAVARAAGRERLNHDDLMEGFIAIQRNLGDVLSREVFRHRTDELRAVVDNLFFDAALPV